MKDEQTAQGFSFQLSESAPPAEAIEGPEDGPSWFSAKGDRLDLDLDAFAASPPPAKATSAEDATRTPAPVDATSPPPPVAHTQGANARVQEAAVLAPQAEASHAVRRIEFPSRKSAPRQPEAGARSPKTVFSRSVSQAPRAHLLSNDDAPEPRVMAAPPKAASEPAARRTSSPHTALRPRPPKALPERAVTRERLLELAQRGASLGRERTRALGSTGAQVARRASDLGALWLRKGQERLAQARSKSAAPAALCDDGPAEPATDEAATSPERSDAAPPRSASRKPWFSGGAAAMVAAIGCYMGASHLLTFAAPPSSEPSARAEATSDEAASPAEPSLSKASEATPAGSPELAPEPTKPSGPVDEKSLPKARSASPPALEQLALPEGLNWPKKGLIEVVTSGSELVYVDGVFTGRGPLRRIPIAPGSHEVEVRTEGQTRRTRLDVSVGKRARVVFGA